MSVPQPIAAQAIVEVDYGAGEIAPQTIDLLARVVREQTTIDDSRAGERPALRPHEVQARWRERVLFAPPDDAPDVAALTRRLVSGRNLFFEGEFDALAEVLESAMADVERAPAALAFHPDVAPVAIDAFLILARALDVLGREDARDAVLARVADLFWFAAPDPADHPASLIDRFDQLRAARLRRTVPVEWHADSVCVLTVNGVTVDVASGGALELPSAPQFARLRCGDGPSHVHRVDGLTRRLRFDQRFERALDRRHGETLLDLGGTVQPPDLRPLLEHASHVLAVHPLLSAGRIPAGAPRGPALELAIADAGGETPFRVVRIPERAGWGEDALGRAWQTLRDDRPRQGVARWIEGRGWVEPGIFGDEGPPPIVAENQVDAGSLEGRSARRWGMATLAMGVATGATAAGAWVWRDAALGDVSTCADDVACVMSGTIDDRRGDARTAHRGAVSTTVTAGVLATVGTVLLLFASRWADGSGGTTVGLGLSPEGRGAGLGLSLRRVW